jgi:tetratricopeptide (TPR) repeat protein
MGSNNEQNEKEPLFLEENKKAEEFIEAGDFPSAAKILVDIVDKDPKNWRAYNNMGIISWETGTVDEAYTTFKYTCELKPDYVDALINLFDVSLKLRKINEVLPIMKQALQMIPDNEEIKAIVDSIEEQGEQIYSSERAMRVLKKNSSTGEE